MPSACDGGDPSKPGVSAVTRDPKERSAAVGLEIRGGRSGEGKERRDPPRWGLGPKQVQRWGHKV